MAAVRTDASQLFAERVKILEPLVMVAWISWISNEELMEKNYVPACCLSVVPEDDL